MRLWTQFMDREWDWEPSAGLISDKWGPPRSERKSMQNKAATSLITDCVISKFILASPLSTASPAPSRLDPMLICLTRFCIFKEAWVKGKGSAVIRSGRRDETTHQWIFENGASMKQIKSKFICGSPSRQTMQPEVLEKKGKINIKNSSSRKFSSQLTSSLWNTHGLN